MILLSNMFALSVLSLWIETKLKIIVFNVEWERDTTAFSVNSTILEGRNIMFKIVLRFLVKFTRNA